MNFYHRNRPVTLPHIYFRVSGSRYWDIEDVMGVLIGFFLILSVGITLVGIGWHIAHRVNAPPPKVITKVIKQNGLTTAQNEYIQQCEQNTQDSGTGDVNHGIPNVAVNPWTCTFAKP